MEAMGGNSTGKEAPLKIELGGVLRDRFVGQARGCRNCNRMQCDYGSNDLCYNAKKTKATLHEAKQEAKAHMRRLNVAGPNGNPLWGKAKLEAVPPIVELKGQSVRIAKLVNQGGLEGTGEGVTVKNGAEEANDTILYAITQIKDRNS